MKKNIYRIIILILIALPLISSAGFISVETGYATNITTTTAQFNGLYSTTYGNVAIDWAKFKYTTGNPNQSGSFFSSFEISATVGPPSTWQNQRRLTANKTGLQPGTNYYVQAVVQINVYNDDNQTDNNIIGQHIYTGEWTPFTTLLTNPDPGGPGGPGNPGNPGSGINMIPATAIGDVHTINPATGITDVEATFHGSVSGIEGGTAYGYFRYSSQKTPPVFCNDIFGSNMRSVAAGATGGNHASGVVSNGSFDAKVINLVPNTVYHYCAVVSNGAKSNTIIKYGEVRSIRTYPCQTCDQTQIKTLPTVVINGTSVNLHGEYGSTKALTTYFEYKSTEIAGDWKKTPEESHVKNSYGRMTNLITGLRPSTHYVVRAVGRTADPVETFFGQTSYFQTYTADGFGDNEGWIFDGPTPWESPQGPGLECAEAGLDNPIQGCEDYVACNPVIEDCDGGTDNYCNPAVEDCDGGTDVTCNPQIEDCDDGIDVSCDPATQDCDGGIDTTCDPVTQDCDGGIDVGCNPATENCGGGGYGDDNNDDDFDNDNIGDGNDPDMDGDGNTNTNDSDTDGDGLGNGVDTDDDNDGVFDYSDSTPLGFGSNSNDLDGDGLSNSVDTDDDGDGIPDTSDQTPFGTSSNINDLDGDGINNSLDTDVDGDGIPNNTDPDDDNDGLPDHLDDSPLGNGFVAGSNQNGEPQIGDDTNPPSDAIVRHHEGVETVFIRQIMRNTALAKKYGYRDGEDMQKFSWYLAHFLGKSYGYVAKNKKEVRVRYEDVAAYELKEVGNTTTVYESFDNMGKGNFKITGVRKLNSLFKMIFKYEYYFLKRR